MSSKVERLPPETLSQIFLILTQLDPGPRMLGIILHLGWITVTHVCHRWRQVALGYAALWWRFDFGVPITVLSEMLVRSNGTPIDLIARDTCCVIPVDWRQLHQLLAFLEPKHVSRVRSLHLQAGSGTCTPSSYILDMFSEPAPSLESVVADGRDPLEAVNGTSFALNQPCLRELRLGGVVVLSWANPNLPNLVDLSLGILPGVDFGPPTAEEVLEVLRSAPRLKRLELLAIRLTRAPDSGSLDSPVLLSSLETLSLSDYGYGDCMHLVSLLQFPSSAHVDITTWPKRSLRAQLKLLSQRASEFGPLRRFMLNAGIPSFLLEFRQQEQCQVPPLTPSVFKIVLVFPALDLKNKTVFMDAMETLTSSLSFQGLRYAEIYSTRTIPAGTWMTLFDVAHGVQEVVAVDRGAVDALLAELAEYMHDGRPAVSHALELVGTEADASSDEEVETAPGVVISRGEVLFRTHEERCDRGHSLWVRTVYPLPHPVRMQKATDSLIGL
ncbi:hypothetical protein BC834DRAFT_843876 [Gloeopeniophorella convolvens]|nr:hypothetical protein BC834DRAFT_843876 [Gloeopeniophorella convolvens]